MRQISMEAIHINLQYNNIVLPHIWLPLTPPLPKNKSMHCSTWALLSLDCHTGPKHNCSIRYEKHRHLLNFTLQKQILLPVPEWIQTAFQFKTSRMYTLRTMLLLRKQPLAPVCCYLRMLHNKPASWSTSCSPLIRALGLSTSSTAAGLLSTTGAATGCSITGSGTGLWNTGIQYGSEYIYFALQRLMHIFWTAHHSKPSHIAEQGNCKLCK